MAKASTNKLSAFRPIEAPRRLTYELVSRLTADITNGRLPPGSKLPTELEMIAAMGVSRTVVREAVAALRADGLVVTRQGVGAFVADNASRPFRIRFDELRSLREVLDVMELRTGIEIEAAGFAAERATAAQKKKIAAAYDAIDRAIKNDDLAVDQDFALHCCIAEAANNPQFSRFLEYLGRFIIPRRTIGIGAEAASGRRAYLKTIQSEHRDIVAAIREGAVSNARAAMRAHLLNSRKRYQTLAAEFRDR